MTLNRTSEQMKANVAGAKAALEALAAMAKPVEAAAARIAETLRSGGKLLTCGNGGSAAEASHLAAELVGRYKIDRPAYPCICLSDAGSVMTCVVNDFGYQHVFSRQVEAFGQRGDVLVVFSTSGNSENIVNALTAAKQRNVTTIALLGKGGGRCAGMADVELIAPGADTARVQEMHLLILHTLCDLVEEALGHC